MHLPGFNICAQSHSEKFVTKSFSGPEFPLVRHAGFREVRHVSAATLAQRYFAGRTDGLRPPDNSEELLLATT